jgi:glyoxylase-like metal-dependent hydrolase (beta-lactamase superfamily II)
VGGGARRAGAAAFAVVVGSVELEPLTDAVGRLGALAEIYPQVPEASWEPYRELYPDLFAGDEWRVPCTCYLVRSGGRTLLVDTGVGPPGLWDWEPEWEGGLLPELARVSVAPEDVDVVLITHVHVDHVGWNSDVDGEVVFPRARFMLHAEAVAAARARSERPSIQRCILPLLERGLVDELADGAEVVPGVTAIALPGHDPGHVGLRIGGEAVLIAVAAVHPALLNEPGWLYEFDYDAARAAETRRALVEELADTDTLVACGHYPGGGIGRVSNSDGGVIWEEAHTPAQGGACGPPPSAGDDIRLRRTRR